MKSVSSKLTKKINRYVFFLVTSTFMFFGVNISFFLFFALFIFSAFKTNLGILRLNNEYKIFALLFGLGALFSVINQIENEYLFGSSLRVLLNYIYWPLMILFFSSFKNRFKIDQNLIFKTVSFSVIFVMFYYIFFQDYISNKYFIKFFNPNNLAFLLISFVPYLLFYLKNKYSTFLSLIVLLIILSFMLFYGRRAGFGLILIGGILAIFFQNFNFKSLSFSFKSLLLVLSLYLIFQIPQTKTIILNTSPRIHSIIYDDIDELSSDRSQLVRYAMIEKGILLYSENLFFGVGLNNFSKTTVEVGGDFEGSQYVLDKDIYTDISSHNSFINLIAEGGLFLFVPFILIIIFIIKDFIFLYEKFNNYDIIIFISCLCMLTHCFFINGIVNSIAWLNISLAIASIIRVKNKL